MFNNVYVYYIVLQKKRNIKVSAEIQSLLVHLKVKIKIAKAGLPTWQFLRHLFNYF